MADDIVLYAEGRRVAALLLGAEMMKHTVGRLILRVQLKQDFPVRSCRFHLRNEGKAEIVRSAGAEAQELPFLEAGGKALQRARVQVAITPLGCKGAPLSVSIGRF